MIGWVSVPRSQHDPARGDLGYWLGEPLPQHGYMSEAARAALDAGFARLDLAVVEAGRAAGQRGVAAHHAEAGHASDRPARSCGPRRGTARKLCEYFEITRDAGTRVPPGRLTPAERGLYVALLRGINVGGRSLHKDALRDAFTRAGGADARTFIQSGNVVFRAAPGEVDAIVAGACRRLRPALGVEPVVMVRSAAEIARLLRQGPFARHGGAGDREALHRVPRRPAGAPPAAPAPPAEGGARSRPRVEARVLGGEPAQAERLVRISRRLRRTRRGRRRHGAQLVDGDEAGGAARQVEGGGLKPAHGAAAEAVRAAGL